MAANWLRDLFNGAGKSDGRTPSRRKELRLESLEDRTVPAVLEPTGATNEDDGPVVVTSEEVVPTDVETPTEGTTTPVPVEATSTPAPVNGLTPLPGQSPLPSLPTPPLAEPTPTTPVPQTREGRINWFMTGFLAQEKVRFNPIEAVTTSWGGQNTPRLSDSEIEFRRLSRYNQSTWGQDPRKLTVVNEQEPNDSPDEANNIPAGTGAGQDVDVQVNGAIDTNTDVDFFAVDLQAGDIIGGTVVGAGTLDPTVAFFDPNGFALMANDDDAISLFASPESPLPTSANASDPYFAVVVGETGRYTIAVASSGQASSGAYQMNLAVRRPVLETAPIGQKQKLFLDFDGGVVPAGTVSNPADATLSPLSAFLTNWGLTAADEDAVIDAIVAQVQRDFDAVRIGGAVPGTNPNYDFEILNSRDDPDTFGTDPFVSRIFVGGTAAELGVSTIGIAQFVEPGNFSLDDTAVVLLDTLSAPAGQTGFSANDIQLAAGLTIIDAIGAIVGNITAHEAGHYFGLIHTDNASVANNIIDTGGNFNGVVGSGPDGILGNADDVPLLHVVDVYDPNQGNSGNEDSTNTIAWGLTAPAATVTTQVLSVFDVSTSMAAISGIDVNGDGVVDDLDDVNGEDGQGSLLDFALQTASVPTPSVAGNIIFARESRVLDMDPNGADFIDTSVDLDGNGVSDYFDTIRSIRIGEGGYFTSAQVNPNPTLYDSVLDSILITATPDTLVTIYTDGSGRLADNSLALQRLVDAGIAVNVVLIGPYQNIAPTDDIELIAQATGGVVRSFASLSGRPLDGGFPTTVTPGGNPGSGYLWGNGRQYAGFEYPVAGNGGSGNGGSGNGGSGNGGSGTGGGTGSGSDGDSGSEGDAGTGDGAQVAGTPLGVYPGPKVVVNPLDTVVSGGTNTGATAGLGSGDDSGSDDDSLDDGDDSLAA